MIRLFLVFIFLANNALASQVNSIIVEGNERVESETIISYLNIRPGEEFDQDKIASAYKRIFNSDLFSKVDIKLEQNTLKVLVKENPKINLVVFEGNKKIKTKDLEHDITLRPRSIFTAYRVQEDVNHIIDHYNKNGRFSVKVTPQIINLPQNRVNLIYKIDEGPVAKIEKIFFVGNNSFQNKTLQDEISSKESQWYLLLSSSDNFNPSRLEYDREMLTKFYHSRGFADFKIISVVTNVSENKDKFYITFTFEEGDIFKFGKIDLVNDLRSESIDITKLKKQILTKSGKLYTSQQVERSIDEIIKEINDLGFAFVDIEPEVELDREKKLVNINYHIFESRKFYIRNINIKGNVKTLDKVIRREFRLAEGDPYNSTKINRSEERVNNLDYFEPLHIETSKTEEDDKVDLNVNIQEKSTAGISLAGGWSTVDGPIFRIGFSEPNFLGKGQIIDFNISRAKKRLDVEFSFTEPYLFDKPISGGFDLFSSDVKSDLRHYRSYNQKSYGGVLRAGYNLTEFLIHQVHYRLEKSTVSNIATSASLLIREQLKNRITSLIGHALVYDRRNNSGNPTRGYILTVGQDYAGLGGSAFYLKHTAKARFYYPVINEDVVFILGGDGGHIKGIRGKQVSGLDNFYMGGPGSLRGFDFNGVGPRAKDTNESLGGKTFYSGFSELRFPLGFGKDIGLFGAGFVEVGTLYNADNYSKDQAWDVMDSKKLRSSYGVGLGISTPVGPIRVYYALPIRKTKFDQTKRFDIEFKTNF